jgi:predicted PurR-regulated permease PerM
VKDLGKHIYEVEPEPQADWRSEPPSIRTLARWALGVAAFYLVFWLLLRAGAALLPFVIGLLLAYLLQPIVNRLDRHMPRWAAILIVYLVGLAVLALAFMFIVPPVVEQINQFVRTVPERAEQVQVSVQRTIDEFQRTASDEVREQINQQVRNVQQTLQRNATTYAQQIGEFLFTGVLSFFQTIAFLIGFLVIPFFLFYTLNGTPQLPAVVNNVLHPKIRADFWNIWRILDRLMGSYVRGQLILGIIIGVTTFIGLWALKLFGYDISYTVLLSILAGIGELIPFLGPILSAIPAIIVAFGDGLSAVLAVIVLYVIIQQVESQVLVPRIVGNVLRLHPAVLLVLFVLGAAVGGLLLVILAPLLAAIARDIFIYLHRRLREPPQPPEMAIAGLLEDEPSRSQVEEVQTASA